MKRKLPEIIEIEEDTKRAQRLDGGISRPSQPPTLPEDAMYARISAIFPEIRLEHVRQLYMQHKKSGAEVDVDVDIGEALINHIIDAGAYAKGEMAKHVDPGAIVTPSDISPRKGWGKNDESVRDDAYYQKGLQITATLFLGDPFIEICRIVFLEDYPNLILLQPGLPQHLLRVLYMLCFAVTEVIVRCTAHTTPDQAEHSYSMNSPYKPHLLGLLNLNRNQLDQGLPKESVKAPLKPYPPRVTSDLDQTRALGDVKAEITLRRGKELDRLGARNGDALAAEAAALMECQCCYVESPINRMVYCTGDNIHFFCVQCTRSLAKSLIGIMKYDVKCMDTSGCAASFDKQTLRQALGQSLIDKLEELEQLNEIAKADIEGLHGCPFCDFKAICPPIDDYSEFACQNPTCKKVSCRFCEKESHIPMSCKEARDKRLPARAKIEEAMSDALIRTCPNPKCQVKMVKENGCNKMVCVKCGWVMCYACRKKINKDGYGHFNRPPSHCPIHDSVNTHRHFDDVSSAHKKATEEAMKNDPDLKPENLGVEAPMQESYSNTFKSQEFRFLQRLQNQHLGNNDMYGNGPNANNRGGFFPAAHAAPMPLYAHRNPPHPAIQPAPFAFPPIANSPNRLDWAPRLVEPSQPVISSTSPKSRARF
ncbi:uncharacterized protein PADG_03427 [Paracoccidioides brasiliensis Pb18]|uniref:RING-type domain-containing protein n=1 Tax=Paracoccidioides brasiliensis (strain Pb18) TaxID=502780 RepID=C1G557_PARBD|nr:uncharacterized protein PADG_03427 [Paracoccidioides brasiliensis Pb18]EEH47329.2 hypothetical protein PADG_03427 [Paracoccidioides brasiliensis Pb18]